MKSKNVICPYCKSEYYYVSITNLGVVNGEIVEIQCIKCSQVFELKMNISFEIKKEK
jgi:predicted Zn finger-like uncharacterized protein